MTVVSPQNIKRLVRDLNLISPFVSKKTYAHDGIPVLSYGLSNAGYDIRLSSKSLKLVKDDIRVLDVKNIKETDFVDVLIQEKNGHKFIDMPPWSFVLGTAMERLAIPSNIVARCYNKSSYARAGIIPHVTPVEPGWEGWLTLEISNLTGASNRLYVEEGIVQLVFEWLDEDTNMPYGEGRYQNQEELVTIPRITNPC